MLVMFEAYAAVVAVLVLPEIFQLRSEDLLLFLSIYRHPSLYYFSWL